MEEHQGEGVQEKDLEKNKFIKKQFLLKKIQPGLSVWMWGPTMWDILHSVAYVSDTQHKFTPAEMTEFYTLLGALLPCRYCRDSYGGFLEQSLEEKKCQVPGDACDTMRLGLLIYDVHERVNRKLLVGPEQKFDKLKMAVPGLAALNIDPEIVWSCMNSQPTQMILYKRGMFFENDPMKLDATWLLVLAISQRITDETRVNFNVFLSILARTLDALPFKNAEEMARFLINRQKLADLFDNYYSWFSLQCKSPVNKSEFLAQTQRKLSMMISGACGAGTCK